MKEKKQAKKQELSKNKKNTSNKQNLWYTTVKTFKKIKIKNKW